MLPGRPFRILCALALSCLLLLTSCTQLPLPSKDNRPASIRFQEKVATVPAQLVGKVFVIEAKWDRHGPWRFLIDTGSSVTLVSPEFAKRYSVSARRMPSSPVNVRAADGTTATFPSTTLRAINLGGAQFSMVPALVSSQDDISAHLGVRIDGILGFPFFKDTIWSLDYPGKRLVLRPATDETAVPSNAIPFNEEMRTPRIKARMGSEELTLMVDTGSDAAFVLNPKNSDVHYAVPPRQGGLINSLVGRRPYQIGRLADDLTIGDNTVQNPVVILTGQVSAIGSGLLRNFVITFDPARQRLAFNGPATHVQPGEPFRHCGLSFTKTPAYWRVETVVPGSPAEHEGIRIGDLVVRINGEPVSKWPLPRFEALVLNSPEIIFTFLQGSRESPHLISTFELVPLAPTSPAKE